MPVKGNQKPKESIRTYFGTRSSSKEPERNISSKDDKGENLVRDNMAEAQSEVIQLIKGLDTKMSAQATTLEKLTTAFEGLNSNISKLTEKVDGLEMEVEGVKEKQMDDRETMNKMRKEIEVLKNSLLSTQAYARKYHLLLYGVEGHEKDTKDTIAVVRKFAKDNLKLGGEFAERMTIRNAHRLQKRTEGPATIVIVFLFWNERDAFLKAGPELRGTKMRVATDLPPELKKKRGQLATIAYEIRRDEKLLTRIREKGAELWLETRKADDPSSSWTRRPVLY